MASSPFVIIPPVVISTTGATIAEIADIEDRLTRVILPATWPD
jgi:hypothetical protein